MSQTGEGDLKAQLQAAVARWTTLPAADWAALAALFVARYALLS